MSIVSFLANSFLRVSGADSSLEGEEAEQQKARTS